MLSELIHGGVGDAHVPEHSLQFRRELTAAFSLIGEDQERGQTSVSERYYTLTKDILSVGLLMNLCHFATAASGLNLLTEGSLSLLQFLF